MALYELNLELNVREFYLSFIQYHLLRTLLLSTLKIPNTFKVQGIKPKFTNGMYLLHCDHLSNCMLQITSGLSVRVIVVYKHSSHSLLLQ